ncbi:hypothetical protein [Endozoicomonas montiporae]|uniref:Uncharacterized protein n=1 Tax=Endozoicomonas montiporae CL-33 TaxID=570277 RepID=A0A142BGA6_9GAMM|nr:hypothetical protein [Endozoicomonas montiporae]AMO57782.1 hypothetical protein EZMO1_3840 [Endozoicomonas montiporae CL-33]
MTFSDKYKGRYANFLIGLAWTVEIIAVLIGLTIAIVVSTSASESLNSQETTHLFGSSAPILVAGLPFLLVAVVELCKIPLTFAFMAVKNVFWRGLFLFFVAFLCLITFETMLNGFERNFSNLNYAIDTRKNNIENIDAEIELLNRRADRLQVFTADDLARETEALQLDIDEQYRTSVNRINSETEAVISGIDYDYQETLDAEVLGLMERRDSYYNNWNTERQQIEDRFSELLLGNLSDSRNERQRLLQELEALKQEMNQALVAANFFTRTTIDNKYRRLIAAKNQQIDQITTGYLGGDALTKQATMEEQLKQQLSFANSKYEGRISEINQRIEDKKQSIIDQDDANARLQSDVLANADRSRASFLSIKLNQEGELAQYTEGKQAELDAISGQVNELEDAVFLLQNDQRNVQAEINHMINQNQVYRLAMYAFGKESPTDVDRQMVGIVALIWFGSLALIASVTGVMLCLAGFYLKRELMRAAEAAEPPEATEQAATERVKTVTDEQEPEERKTREVVEYS